MNKLVESIRKIGKIFGRTEEVILGIYLCLLGFMVGIGSISLFFYGIADLQPNIPGLILGIGLGVLTITVGLVLLIQPKHFLWYLIPALPVFFITTLVFVKIIPTFKDEPLAVPMVMGTIFILWILGSAISLSKAFFLFFSGTSRKLGTE